LIDIGGMPIIWHIMKYYSLYGYTDFIICAGYKQNCIKEYFSDYFVNNSDITFDMKNNKMVVHKVNTEPWIVTVVDTGYNTMTGGRVKRIKEYIGNEPFMLTYGDGVADVDIDALIDHHKQYGKLATITAVMPGGRFGALNIEDSGLIGSFREKRKDDGGWINGGFMVLEPEIFNYIENDGTVLENEPFEKLVAEKQLTAYKHFGFWQCMDSVKDKMLLEKLIAEGRAPWIKW
jgi:glucose-1-phosphate cytidylyltransferase